MNQPVVEKNPGLTVPATRFMCLQIPTGRAYPPRAKGAYPIARRGAAQRSFGIAARFQGAFF